MIERDAPPARPASRARAWAASWAGLVPFFLFSAMFLGLPLAFLAFGSIADNKTGAPTIDNYASLSTPLVVNAFKNSIEVSLVTAIVGGVFGFLLALAVILGRLPRILRSALMTFSGVASNFAGIPLALAFTYTLSTTGFVTVLLKNVGVNLYAGDFTIFSKLGLEIVYLYFQFPLMVLIIAPAIDGLKPEWREAAENMGATGFQYWRRVALPILTPTLLGSMILLFGNSFGAQATAYQLTAGQVALVPLAIGNQISGDVLHNVGLGYAMAMGMVAVMGVSIVGYTLLQRRSGAVAAMTGTGGPSIGLRAPGALESVASSAAKAERPRRQYGTPWAWVIFLIGVLYFTMPLIATFEVSMRAKPFLAAYTNSFGDPRFLSAASPTRSSSG